MTRRVVFLDIDGVLASIRGPRACVHPGVERDCRERPRRRRRLVHLAAWQDGRRAAGDAGSGEVHRPRRRQNSTGAPRARRGEEIGAWLAEHAVCGYVIIDDHIDMGELRTELVLTHGPWATASRRAASHRDTTQLLE